MKLSKYFELINPSYTYIQIIPHRSIRNYNSSNITKAISTTYKAVNSRIHREQKKVFFETNFKMSYIMDIQKNDSKFYFLIPVVYKSLIIDKITEIWKQATIKEVDTIGEFPTDYTTYSMGYKKDDTLSLQIDKKSNEPLNTILNVIDIMEGDDIVRIAYNFMPISQRGWLERYEDMQYKLKNNRPLEKNVMSFDYILKATFVTVLGVMDSLLEVLQDFTGSSNTKDEVNLYQNVMNIIGQQNKVSAATKKKKDSTIINTQIAVMSKSENSIREANNALSVCHNYSVLTEDNELV